MSNEEAETAIVESLRRDGPALFRDLRARLAGSATDADITRALYRLHHSRRSIRNRVVFPVHAWHAVEGCPCAECREGAP